MISRRRMNMRSSRDTNQPRKGPAACVSQSLARRYGCEADFTAWYVAESELLIKSSWQIVPNRERREIVHLTPVVIKPCCHYNKGATAYSLGGRRPLGDCPLKRPSTMISQPLCEFQATPSQKSKLSFHRFYVLEQGTLIHFRWRMLIPHR